MSNKLILAWRNPLTRLWTPVGILEHKNNTHLFYYTNGASAKNFTPFGQMLDLDTTYQSKELFPLFKNRLLSKSRPEYEDYLNWLDIDTNKNNDLLELARSGGIRATDELQLFSIPKEDKNGDYEVLFFSHGISHMAENYVKRLSKLKKDDKLLLLKDVQNKVDPYALVLRTEDDPVEVLGYCPSFFAKDFTKLLNVNDNNVNVVVQKVNSYAPLQLKLLCKLTTKFPKDFKPFDSEVFRPYGKNK